MDNLKVWSRIYYEGEADFAHHPPRHVLDLMEYLEDLEALQASSAKIRAFVDV